MASPTRTTPYPLPTGDTITGLVLAGGRGSRMGGVDKGLQAFNGQPLARHALERLAPQVGGLMISANRHAARYAAFGVPVWPDTLPDHPGPLAGILSGLAHCETPWLATVPCDCPAFPHDLVDRLAQAIAVTRAEIAMVNAPDAFDADGHTLRAQPVFSLMRRTLRDSLARFLAGGGHRVRAWIDSHATVRVPFQDAAAFANANTLDELRMLEARCR